MESHSTPPNPPPPESSATADANEQARAAALRRARLSVHMRRHERALPK